MKSFVYLPQAFDLMFAQGYSDDVGVVAAADNGRSDPGQAFDFVFEVIKVEAEDVGAAVDAHGIKELGF